MHALSKKLYYEVMKSGQEDTILESDSEVELYEQEETAGSSDVGCFVRIHLKSNAVQTQWSRGGKNFRNQYTNTGDMGSHAMLLRSPISRLIAVHQTPSYEDIAITRVHCVQTSTNHKHSPAPSGNILLELLGLKINEDMSPVIGSEQVLNSKKSSKITKSEDTEKMDECTSTDCKQCYRDQETCNCSDYKCIPCNRGLASCRNFTLGTIETRLDQNERCGSKLIGGCRVPCKSYKSRF